MAIDYSNNVVACVTGASGLIGRRIVEKLLYEDYKVRVLTRKKNYPYSEHVEIYQGEMSDSKKLNEFVRNSDLVFHCAGEINDEKRMQDVNVNGTKMLISACHNTSIKYLCHISSAGVVGKTQEKFVDESSKCYPQSLYENSKWKAEQLFHRMDLRFSVACLRPTNVVDDYSFGAIGFVSRGSLKNMFKTFIKGREYAHVVHAIDVANAAIYLSTQKFEGPETFFISCDSYNENKYAKIWSLFRSMENKNIYPVISTSICMPLVLAYMFRTLAGKYATKGNAIFSSEKLIGTGYKFRLDVKEIVSRMLRFKNETTECK